MFNRSSSPGLDLISLCHVISQLDNQINMCGILTAMLVWWPSRPHAVPLTLTLSACDIIALHQPCWPDLHSSLQQLRYVTCCLQMQRVATQSSLEHSACVFIVCYVYFASRVTLVCLRFTCSSQLSSLHLQPSTVIASPTALNCLRY